MIVSLLGPAIALRTVVLIVKNLRYFGVTEGMMAPGQRLRDRTACSCRSSAAAIGIALRETLRIKRRDQSGTLCERSSPYATNRAASRKIRATRTEVTS
jgi:hypothetical protein